MLKTVERALTIGSAMALFVLMLITVVDVVGRGLFNAPLPGGIELTELTLAILAFLAYPGIAIRRRHIVVDLFDNVVGTLVKRVQVGLTSILGGMVFGIIAWRLWIQGIRAISEGDSTGTLGIHIGYMFCWMSVMSLITAVIFVWQLGDRLPEQGKSPAETPESSSHA